MKSLTSALTSIVPECLFHEAINSLEVYHSSGTSINWVNWRKGEWQLKVEWNNNVSFCCYFSFKTAFSRDSAHKSLFENFAPEGKKPFLDEGHGWSKLRYNFFTRQLLTIHDVARIIDSLDLSCSLIIAQETLKSLPLFDVMGIPLEAGEMGKEIIAGATHSYSREINKCL